MTKKLPLCAWCGSSLTRKARVTLDFDDLPGKPLVGWCASCCRANKDKLFGQIWNDDDDLNLDIILIIKNRGEGRVT